MRAVVDLIRDGDRRAPSSRYDAQLANQLARVPAAETRSRFLIRLGTCRPGGVRKLTLRLFAGLFAALMVIASG